MSVFLFQDSDTETASSEKKALVPSVEKSKEASREFRSSRDQLKQVQRSSPKSRDGSSSSVSSNRSSASVSNYRPSSVNNNYSNNYLYHEHNHNRNTEHAGGYCFSGNRPQSGSHSKTFYYKQHQTGNQGSKNSTHHHHHTSSTRSRRRRNSSNGSKTVKETNNKDRYQNNSGNYSSASVSR